MFQSNINSNEDELSRFSLNRHKSRFVDPPIWWPVANTQINLLPCCVHYFLICREVKSKSENNCTVKCSLLQCFVVKCSAVKLNTVESVAVYCTTVESKCITLQCSSVECGELGPWDIINTVLLWSSVLNRLDQRKTTIDELDRNIYLYIKLDSICWNQCENSTIRKDCCSRSFNFVLNNLN